MTDRTRVLLDLGIWAFVGHWALVIMRGQLASASGSPACRSYSPAAVLFKFASDLRNDRLLHNSRNVPSGGNLFPHTGM